MEIILIINVFHIDLIYVYQSWCREIPCLEMRGLKSNILYKVDQNKSFCYINKVFVVKFKRNSYILIK